MSAAGSLVCALMLVASGAPSLDGQTPADPPASSDSTAFDRSWTIDVAQREIVERSFGDEASIVAVDEEGRWYICAGAAVTADEVRINLTNVQAEVRLRADPGRLRELFGETDVIVTGPGSPAEGQQDNNCESSGGQAPANQSPD